LKQKIKILLPIFIFILIPFFQASSQFPLTEESVKEKLKNAGNSKDYPDNDVLVVSELVDVTVEETGLAHVNSQLVIKILTEKGAADYPCLRFDYDPATNFIDIKYVKIYRKGTDVEDVPLSSVLDIMQPTDMIYWGPKMKLLPLPRLNPDDAVEMVTYKKGTQIAYLHDEKSGNTEDESKYLPPMKGHFYDIIYFENKNPIKEKRYNLHVLKAKPVQFEVYNGEVKNSLTFEGKDKFLYSFWKEDIPAFTEEANSVEFPDFATKVVLATVPDWQEKSRWFIEVNDPTFKFNDDIKSKVAEITKGLKTDKEKYAALLHWVAQEIRYSGVSMGKGEGYTLHPGIMTFRDRCGVCKDIAGMLVTMLRAAGYETYPAMTMAGSRVERIPADQFNHCVVAVKEKNGSFTMLDPTWAPFSMQVWSYAEGEQNYVIGTPWGEDLDIRPLFTADDSELFIDSSSKISKDGSLIGKLKITATGYSDGRLRSYFSYFPYYEIKSMFQRILNSVSQNAVIDYIDYSDIFDFGKQMKIEIGYKVANYATSNGKYIFIIPPIAKITLKNWIFTSLLGDAELEERKYDALLWYTQKMNLSSKIELPDGFEVINKPEDKKIESDTADFSINFTEKKGSIAIKEIFSSKKRTLPKKDYKDFKQAVDKVKEYSKKEIVLKIKEDKKK
jgi:hypothetical protein